jgi:hypothetical protein
MDIRGAVIKLSGRVDLLIAVICFLILSLMVGISTIILSWSISQLHRDVLISFDYSYKMRTIEVEEIKKELSILKERVGGR